MSQTADLFAPYALILDNSLILFECTSVVVQLVLENLSNIENVYYFLNIRIYTSRLGHSRNKC